MSDDVTLRLGAEVEQAVAKLETVQKKLASIATEVKGGTPIYDAYGRVAATATGQAEDGANKASKANSALGESVGKMIGAFTAASLLERAIGWLAGIGREALTLSSRILDVHDTTGLALDTIQRLEHIERVTNTTQGALADSAFNLGRNLAGGNDSVRAAVAALGLEFDHLQGQRLDESLYDITDALREMEDPNERNRLAVALLGKTWKEIAPAALSDMRALGAGARILAEDQIRATDDAQKAWRSFTSKTMSLLAESAGSVVMFGRAMAIAIGLASSPIENPSIAAQREATAALTRETDALAASYVNATTPVRTLAKELLDAETKVQALTSSQMADIATMQRLGYTQEDIGRKYQLNGAALELLRERQEAERKATEDAARATEEANKKARERQDALERVRLLTVDVTAQQRSQILSLDDLGAAERDIAVKVGVHEVQVRKVIEAERDRVKAADEVAKAIAAAEKDVAAAQAAAAREVRERVQADGVARMQQAAALHEALVDNERKIALAQTTGLERRLLELQYAEQDELAALYRTHDATEASTQEVAALIQARYKAERDDATFTATHIVARMRDQGVLTRAEQEATVAALERDWREMQASGEYTFEQLEEAERRWREASARLAHEGLFRFIDNMNQMLGVAGAAFDAIGGLGNDTTAKIGAVGTRIVQTARLGGEAMAAFATGDWVGAAIKSIQAVGTALQGLFKGNETKKAREEFADSMGLTLDQLYKKLQSMGDKGQELANRALNVIGKHDEAGNRRWMDEVKAFFGEHEQSLERNAEIVARYSENWDRLPAALRAKELAKELATLSSEHRVLTENGWSAEEAIVAQADAYNELIARAASAGMQIPDDLRRIAEQLERTGHLTQENIDYVMGFGTEARKQLAELDAEYKKLSDSIANEAPEEVMGVIEAEARARMAAIEAEKKLVADDLEEAQKKVLSAADVVRQGVERIFSEPLTIPIIWGLPDDGPSPSGREGTGIPGYSSGSGGIQDFGERTLAWLHGLEGVFTRDQIDGIVKSAGLYGARAAAFGQLASVSAASGAGGPGGATTVLQATVNVDGRGAFFTNRQALRDLASLIEGELVDGLSRRGLPIVGGA